MHVKRKRGRPRKEVYIKAKIRPGQTVFSNGAHVSNFGAVELEVLVRGPQQQIMPHLEYVPDEQLESEKQSDASAQGNKASS